MAKTKVNVKGIESSIKTVKKTFNDTKKSARLLAKMGNFSADRIKSFARSGKSLVSGKPKLFPKLKEITKQFRRDVAAGKFIDTDPNFFDPNRDRSNITLTGDLVRGIKSRIEGNRLILFVEENRSDGQTNKKIIKDLLEIDKDYAFMGLDEKGIKRIRRFVVDELRRQIKNNNLNK